MATDLVYTLTLEVSGRHESEALAGTKGAGEAKRQLEKEIKAFNFAAASTNIKFKSLSQNSP